MSQKKTACIFCMLCFMECCFAGRTGLVRAQEPPLTLVVGQTNVYTVFNYYTTSFINDATLPLPEERGAYAEGNAAGAFLYGLPGSAGGGIAEIGVSLLFDLGGYTLDQVRDWPVSVSADISLYEIGAQWRQGQGQANASIDFLGNAIDAIGSYTGDNGTRQKSAVVSISTDLDGSELTLGEIYLKPELRVRLAAEVYAPFSATEGCSAGASVTLNSIAVAFLQERPTTTTTTSPQTGFSVDVRAYPLSGEAPLTVNFSATASKPVTSWLWDFGDKTTSAEQSPVHTYVSSGLYTLRLTAAGESGTVELIKPDFIFVGAAVTRADFFAEPVIGAPPLTVSFFDRSSGQVTGWFWEFGDGATSTEQNPVHTYAAQGRYSVALTVTGKQQSDTKVIFEYIVVSENPVFADFIAEPVSGSVPLTVQFTNASSGETAEQLWDFGDGQYSDEQHPRHTYVSPGSYSVGLRVPGPEGVASEIKESFITVTPDADHRFSIYGTVTGTAADDVAVFLSGGEMERMTWCAADGTFVFDLLAPGAYGVTPFKNGIMFDPPFFEVPVGADAAPELCFNARTGGPGIAAAYAEPNKITADGTTPVRFVALIDPQQEAAGVESVIVDLAAIGGDERQMLFDDGTHGDEIAGDWLYSFQTTVPTETPPGPREVFAGAFDSSGGRNFALIDFTVTRSFSGTLATGVFERKVIENDIQGQTLVTAYALVGGSARAASQQGQTAGASSLVLQIFDPDMTPFFASPVPMSTQSAELLIPNAGAGTWTYEIQNTGSQSSQYSLSVTTAGTGFVSGTVADAQTGQGLDSVTVVSSGGLSTVTTGGYYALLHPAGVFSLQTRSGSYLTASRSVTISAGGASEANMVLQRTSSDNGTRACVFAADIFALPRDAGCLSLLRTFRDSVLARTARGRHCTGLYYRYSREISSMLRRSPKLKQQVETCALNLLPAVSSLIEGRPCALSTTQLGELRRCLAAVKRHAGKSLRQEIIRWERQMALRSPCALLQ